MKKIISLFLAFAMMLTALPTIVLPAFAEDTPIIPTSVLKISQNEDWIFEISECPKDVQGKLILPDWSGVSAVEGIAAGTFQDCTGITEVLSSINLNSIGDNAFAGCTSLTKFEFFYNIKSIGANAFKDCPVTFYIDINSPALDTIVAYAEDNNIPYELMEHKYYTITYDVNGGAYKDIPNFDPEEVYETFKSENMQSSLITISSAAPKKVGCEFWGWEDEDGNLYQSGSSMLMIGKDVTVTPVYRMIYRITFHAEDYENTPTVVSNIVGSKQRYFDKEEFIDFELQATSAFSCKGYKLSKWYCPQNDTTYNAGASFQMLSENVDMYAVWNPVSYKFTFKANNGTSDSFTASGVYTQGLVMPECTFTREGYHFTGWKYGTESTIYKTGDVFEIVALANGLNPKTFTAQWAEGDITTPIYGDLDGDGIAGKTNDIVVLAKYLNNTIKLSSETLAKAQCDLTGDSANAIDTSDLTALISYLLGEINSLPVQN
ncbi:MAG: InlB B-repeat-containing protein [Oscillospiraceae bacterium]|jgi:uncharacterized repeat protein (TIGR02543 family)|nr:InlB B-repeat-containing protein [Oscillospiraceae bacterium]